MELECERIRREEVESQVDELRQQLQQQTLNLEESQKKLQEVSLYSVMETINTGSFIKYKSPTEIVVIHQNQTLHCTRQKFYL